MTELYGTDAYSPKQIAERVESVGVVKARLPLHQMITLGILAGGFIGLGAMFFTLVTSDAQIGFALSRLLGGLSFSLGLILVVVAGAELFTGNNLLVMAWTSQKISTSELLKNWAVVFFANFVGAVGLAVLVALSQYGKLNQGGVLLHMMKIAVTKSSMPFVEAFFKGILCNILVCLAVWMSLGGRSLTDKIFAIVFPISAFVACGMEHSVANMYFIGLGLFQKTFGNLGSDITSTLDLSVLNLTNFSTNLVAVTLGNLVGGSVMVAIVYHFVYRTKAEETK